ncbi:RNA polymerase sigma factor [Haloferula rosea]|uniref:RNA polymerase sigma factor n=1 Tax=Haloferula rosea TaxID=490093 RepID=A0A934RBK7_9BACT|nr:sigma-70 family RNA polymerase sigma factor [Haloferula rosea]MBK1825986.1 sigma-70 family RNA polymerase sigma factor [Haloferula rosea]
MRALTITPRFLEMPEPDIQQDTDSNAVDVALMRQIAKGDERAFRELVERHQHAVVGTIAKMLRDPTEAEDLAQQTFLRVWKHAKRWKPDAKFTTYLYTIARNLVYNESRRRSRRKEVSRDERQEASGQEVAAESRTEPDAEVAQWEAHQEIDEVIASLPESQRMAVILYAYESLSYEEIGKVLGVSVASVKSLMFRARSALRDKLGHMLGY